MELNNEPAKNSNAPLPRSLCLAMALQFGAGGAVIPFISLLFRDRGLEWGQISLIYSVSSATLLFSPFFWGMLADRYLSLNRVFLLLNLLACLALGGIAVQGHFLGMLIAFTIFHACFNPTLMLINPLSFPHLSNPGEQFGLLRSWGSIGWIIPFLPISLWLARGPGTNLDFILYLAIVLCLGMAVVTFWVPYTPPGAVHEQTLHLGGAEGYGPAVKRLLMNGNYLVLLISFLLVAGSFSLLIYYSPPFLEELGVPRHWLGPIQAIGVLFEIGLFYWQPALIRRWNYSGVIITGCVALFLRHLLYATLGNLWILSFSYILAGMVIVFFHIGVSMLVHQLAPREARATAQSLLVLCGSGLGPMLANWAAGMLTSRYEGDLRVVFWLAALMAGAAALLIAWRGKQINRAAG
jgi:MFS family permease